MKFIEAIQELSNNKNNKFVETIDLAIRLNINPKKQEQAVRESCLLPNPIPKDVRLLVIDDTFSSEEAKELGVTHYGDNDMIEKIQGGWFDFDVIITTPKMMPKVLKLGKLLGPKGLMPNAKLGNITNDLKKSIADFKKGKTEFKNDSFGNLHIPIGKMDFESEKLLQNFEFIMNLLRTKKPATVKGQFIKKVFVTSTMGKAFELELQ